jgi:diguanylate cyclase (GGDEF)-like protein
MPQLPAAARPLVAPAAILALTVAAMWLAPPLPGTLAGLRTVGPYVVLVAGLALAYYFNRGRSFVILASLLAALTGYHLQPSKALYTALCVLVPLNALLAFIRPERGARYRAAYGWLLLIGAEAATLAWIGTSDTAWEPILDHWALRSPPAPLVGRLMFAAAFAMAVRRAWPEFTPAQVGNAGALAAFFIAVEWIDAPGTYAAFMSAAGLVLALALLQESHRLAFRDQLTGLPGRRALEERLRSLGERYAIAMVDIDHFKQFNDTHGHDIGDQVLRLVAGRLAEAGGEGIAYRYGGEEFTVLFPQRGLDEALPDLERIRAAVEKYRMAVRGEDRPKKAAVGAKRRGARTPDNTLSVTVSIGAAAPGGERRTPQQVLKAADEALYRAKKAGRNRVEKDTRL